MQINNVTRVAGYHLRNIAFIKKYVDENIILKLVHNHVISRLDYCNSLYYGLPRYQLRKLQNIMNRAVRLIKGLSPYDRVTPSLMELHWLPVKARIEYKLCLLTFQALKFGKPDYLRKMLEGFSVDSGIVLRHSSEPGRLNEPLCNSSLGFCSFKFGGPRLYNKLLISVRESNSLDVFRSRLKTFYFDHSYDLVSKTITEHYRL